jgi:hypothetical protein
MTLIRDTAYWAGSRKPPGTRQSPPEEATSVARRLLGPAIRQHDLAAAQAAAKGSGAAARDGDSA